MTNRLHKFLELAPSYKLMLVKAWFMLGCYRAIILLVPFKHIAANLQHNRLAQLPPPLLPARQDAAIMIGRLVAAAARFTPWQSLCLTQVLVAQRLLAKQNIPGQFYLGVRRGCESADDPTGLSGHAWLQCGDVIVNGEAEHEHFTVVSSFGWGGPHDSLKCDSGLEERRPCG